MKSGGQFEVQTRVAPSRARTTGPGHSPAACPESAGLNWLCFGFGLLRGKDRAREPLWDGFGGYSWGRGLFPFSCPTHFPSNILSSERKADQGMTVPIL